MIPGAGIGQVMVIKKAKEMGLTTVVVSPEGDYPGIPYADIIYHEDVRSKEKVLEIARKERIAGIASDQTNIPVESMGYVADALNLTGNSYETCKIYCRKDLMRKKCVELGLPAPASAITDDMKSTLARAREIGYPLMCKPTDNQSSKGVVKAAGEEELKEVYKETVSNAFSGEIILEQFIEGNEYVVDGLAIDSVYKSLIILENENFNLEKLYVPRSRTSPTSLPEDKARELLALDSLINRSFGLENGFSHNEYILNPEDNRFYLIDAAARGGGAFISSHLTPYACGFDTTEMLIRLAMGEPLDISDYPAASKAVTYICFYLDPGEIKRVDGMDKIRGMDSVLGVHEEGIEPGERYGGLLNKSCRLGPVLVGCHTLDELNTAKQLIKNTLVISTDKKDDAIIWE